MKRSVAFALVASASSLAVALSAPSAGAVGLTAQAPPAASPDTPAQAADRLVESEPAILRASPKDRFLRHSALATKDGLNYIAYERTYAGLPVYGGDFVVVTNATGGVLSTSVAQTEPLSVSTTPKIDAAKAAEIARTQISDPAEVAAPKLSVMAQGRGRLAYEVLVTGADRGRESKMRVFVDAVTGEVAEKSDVVRDGSGTSYYNGPVTIGTSGSGTSYSMTDPARPGIRCGGQGGTAYTGTDDSWGNGSGTDLETACVDAMYAVSQEWDMLKSWLGRNGIDGNGSGFPARVGLSDVNAYWNGSYTNFGRSQDGQRQATPIDVVAHEFGHAIFQTTPGGSSGSNEKGGLNESTGDVFGALTEFYANEPSQYDPPDLSVGEEVNLVGDGPIRYMHKPSLLGDPDCYSSSVPNMEVHAAAGVQNHWFYLLSMGTNPTNGQPVSPTCNNTTVTGVGIQKAGQIFMGALNRKTTTWTHQLVRKASLEAAIQLFPGSCTEFNATKAAWNAVSVPAASGEPTSCGSTSNDFSMTLNPASASVQAGQQATSTVGTQTTSGSAQSVTFSASGLPSGATASFSPASVTSGASSTMTISVPAGTAAGTYNVIVTGDGASVDHTATFNLTVGTTGNVVFNDTFETDLGWTVNASGTDTATTGKWERGDPAATSSGVTLQLGTTVSGSNDLVTGRLAGIAAGDYDVDGGLTSVRSPEIALPSGTLTLTFSWYLAHLNNASSSDYFRVRVVSGSSNTVVFQQLGAASDRAGAWQTATVNLSSYAGQTVRLLVETADASTASLIEAGVDDVKITKS